jgi:hypothetical protein
MLDAGGPAIAEGPTVNNPPCSVKRTVSSNHSPTDFGITRRSAAAAAATATAAKTDAGAGAADVARTSREEQINLQIDATSTTRFRCEPSHGRRDSSISSISSCQRRPSDEQMRRWNCRFELRHRAKDLSGCEIVKETNTFSVSDPFKTLFGKITKKPFSL